MMPSRRQCLALAAFLATRAAGAETSQLSVTELPLTGVGVGKFGKKCLLLRPARVPEDTPLPLLLLFHGLGETESEALGIHAWRDRYGLPEAYARLVTPPVVRTLPNKRYLSDARLEEINRDLAQAPLPDLNIVCPFTPNPFKQSPSALLLDQFAEYVASAVLPAARTAAATLADAAHTGVDGVSLGGYISLEVFLRKPQLFGAVGTMQGAFGKSPAEVYARRIADAATRSGPLRVHVTTTTFDPFREASQLLAQRLNERGVNATLTLAEGPHDQTFLREAGSLEMLLFQARALGGQPPG